MLTAKSLMQDCELSLFFHLWLYADLILMTVRTRDPILFAISSCHSPCSSAAQFILNRSAMADSFTRVSKPVHLRSLLETTS